MTAHFTLSSYGQLWVPTSLIRPKAQIDFLATILKCVYRQILYAKDINKNINLILVYKMR